jgi:hypothetical protein
VEECAVSYALQPVGQLSRSCHTATLHSRVHGDSILFDLFAIDFSAAPQEIIDRFSMPRHIREPGPPCGCRASASPAGGASPSPPQPGLGGRPCLLARSEPRPSGDPTESEPRPTGGAALG